MSTAVRGFRCVSGATGSALRNAVDRCRRSASAVGVGGRRRRRRSASASAVGVGVGGRRRRRRSASASAVGVGVGVGGRRRRRRRRSASASSGQRAAGSGQRRHAAVALGGRLSGSGCGWRRRSASTGGSSGRLRIPGPTPCAAADPLRRTMRLFAVDSCRSALQDQRHLEFGAGIMGRDRAPNTCAADPVGRAEQVQRASRLLTASSSVSGSPPSVAWSGRWSGRRSDRRPSCAPGW